MKLFYVYLWLFPAAQLIQAVQKKENKRSVRHLFFPYKFGK